MPKVMNEDNDLVQNLSKTKNESLRKKQNSSETKMNSTPKTSTRRTIGGRGREWAAECLKLLEALLELDDSKPVKEPVNPLKFPEYYSQVSNPIDLSKVMLKFHGGVYHSLDAFSRDMRQMFNNYKMFFKEANTEIYTQVSRLSWWFEAEITRIQEKFGKTIYYKGQPFISVRDTSERRGRPPKQTPLYYDEAQEQADQDEARLEKKPRLHAQSPAYYKENEHVPAANLTTNTAPAATPTENNTNIIVSINHGPCTIATSQEKESADMDNGDVVRPRYIHGLSDPNLQRAISHLKPSTVSQLIGSRRLRGTKSDSPKAVLQRQTLSSHSPSEHVQTNSISASRSPRLNLSTLMLEVTVSNIWFGMSRIKPKKQALLSEEGLQISWTHGDTEIPFTIHAEEIVRCVAHFGRNSHKHTLFLFVLPSCSKRLETLNERYTHCSMIVVFLNIDDITSISTLVHIFWKIGHKSMFGPIFSEIDQKGALLLLGNIKPGIMHRVATKYKGIFSTTEKSTFPDVPGLFNSDSSKEASDLGATSRKRKHSTKSGSNSVLAKKSGSQAAHTSESADAEAQSENIEVSESTIDQLADFSQLLTGAAFDKEFAEKLSASLQQGFKEGVTEVLKNLAANLCNKGATSVSTMDKEDIPEQATDDNNDDESDLEIIIPTDSDDEPPFHSKPKSDDVSICEGEQDLAVTGEKIRIRCPITQQIMKHPLKNIHCGHCYDRQGVEDIIRNRKDKARCPVAGCSNDIPLSLDDMSYDYSLSEYIHDKVNHDSSSNSPKPTKTDSSKN